MTSEIGTPAAFPPPQVEPLQRSPVPRVDPPARRSWWIPLAGVVAGVVGVIGALLPALDGQRVGDPGSTAYRVGVPLGVIGAGLALVAGIWLLARGSPHPLQRGAAIIGIALGSIALFLTVALVFSG